MLSDQTNPLKCCQCGRPVSATVEKVRTLLAEMDAQRLHDDLYQDLRFAMLSESMQGDATALEYVSHEIAHTILDGKPLAPMDRAWLVDLLFRISDGHRAAARELSGRNGRGAPKKGMKSLVIAVDVIRAAMDHGAVSMEDAWNIVAKRQSVDARTVQRYWSVWKSTLDQTIKNERTGAETNLREAMKAMFVTNSGR